MKRVIVVEDDKDINQLIAYHLNKSGYSVESAFDGLEAERKFKSEDFDVAILDIMLPGIDGFSLCKALKEAKDTSKTFVIILTAKAENKDKLYGFLLGADYYLTKPFSIATLMSIIDELSAMRDAAYTVKVR